MIPVLAEAGHRVIAPDLVGFGRSDKPVAANAYTYRSQARRVRRFLEALDLQRTTLFCQDWGGLLGLRVLSERPERFARLVATNTGLPTGEGSPGPAFLAWRRFSQAAPLDVAALMKLAVRRGLSDAEAAAYGAPFPGPEYLQGVHRFPVLVPSRWDHPGAYENRLAAARLAQLTSLPVFLPWGRDPITSGWLSTAQRLFPQATVDPQDNEGHFIQDEIGAELAAKVVAWLATTPS
jgi:haloalkane dehalogenase